jgi:hypothetical protein
LIAIKTLDHFRCAEADFFCLALKTSAQGVVMASNDKSSEGFFALFLSFDVRFDELSAELAHGSSHRSRNGTMNFRHFAFAASTP